MKKTILYGVLALLIGAGAFYGGMKYAGSSANLQANAFRNGAQGSYTGQAGGSQQAGGSLTGQAGARTRAAGGGMVNGQIIGEDAQSITVKLRDGGSKIVFFSDATDISKYTAGTAADLVNGKNVMASGTTNADGSVTATIIQLRPDNAPFGGPGAAAAGGAGTNSANPGTVPSGTSATGAAQ